MRCPSCGADNPTDSVKCAFCQSQLPAASASDKKSIFSRVKRSDIYSRRNAPERHARLPKLGTIQKAFLSAFFLVFIAVSVVMCLMTLGMAGVFGFLGSRSNGFGAAMGLLPLLFAVVPIAFVAIGFFMLRKTRTKISTLENDPVQADAVVVVDKRTEVTGGTGNSTSTHYFVTCEAEDGRRQEYQIWDGSLYGRVSVGDAGVLFVRAGYGLDFDRLTA